MSSILRLLEKARHRARNRTGRCLLWSMHRNKKRVCERRNTTDRPFLLLFYTFLLPLLLFLILPSAFIHLRNLFRIISKDDIFELSSFTISFELRENYNLFQSLYIFRGFIQTARTFFCLFFFYLLSRIWQNLVHIWNTNKYQNFLQYLYVFKQRSYTITKKICVRGDQDASKILVAFIVERVSSRVEKKRHGQTINVRERAHKSILGLPFRFVTSVSFVSLKSSIVYLKIKTD